VTIIFIRVFFIVVSTVVGYQIGVPFMSGGGRPDLFGAAIGFLLSCAIIAFEFGMRKVSVRGLSSAVFGLIFGMIMAKFITDAFVLVPMDKLFASSLQLILTVIFCYLGMVIAIRGRDEFSVIIPYIKFSRQHQSEMFIVLDTSAIIDGRIADLCQTKFLEGRFIVPRFVLRELQQIADSQDALKRNRGRRGLDILNRIKKLKAMDIKIHDEDFPELTDVDAKLVKLAKVLNAKVLTTDYNLNKISELQGVPVLNINDLANALKPVVLPGEIMEVRLIKEGKEYSQAVAYLEDGTMVVVDDAKHMIGSSLNVTITSVLQTSAGRMIFAKPQHPQRPKNKHRS